MVAKCCFNKLVWYNKDTDWVAGIHWAKCPICNKWREIKFDTMEFRKFWLSFWKTHSVVGG